MQSGNVHSCCFGKERSMKKFVVFVLVLLVAAHAV